jgi:hypothetical protein
MSPSELRPRSTRVSSRRQGSVRTRHVPPLHPSHPITPLTPRTMPRIRSRKPHPRSSSYLFPHLLSKVLFYENAHLLGTLPYRPLRRPHMCAVPFQRPEQLAATGEPFAVRYPSHKRASTLHSQNQKVSLYSPSQPPPLCISEAFSDWPSRRRRRGHAANCALLERRARQPAVTGHHTSKSRCVVALQIATVPRLTETEYILKSIAQPVNTSTRP